MPTMLATFGPGLGQQTPAILQLTGQVTRTTGTRRRATRKKATRRASTKRKASRKRSAVKPRRLVKGSRAAKAYMAKIRKMRRK